MNKNLGWKVGIIVGALLVFVYGIFGIPSGLSGGALADALLKPSALRNGIHLGLDLKGGTHLILQVQVNDAVNFETDNAIQTLKAAMNAGKINYAAITKPDPTNRPEQIVIKGIPPASLSQVEETAQSKLPEYNQSTGADGSLALTLKPTSLNQLKDGAVDQAIDTIRGRIDELGVSEPVIERHGLGQYQILLQLPGIDDPVRVKEILQNTAVLEIKLVLDGPFASEQEALQKNNGVLPDDSMLLPGNEVTRSSSEGSEQWYLVTRSSVITGRDMRPQGASVGPEVC
jgi:preprotein translocase subunit SecD